MSLASEEILCCVVCSAEVEATDGEAICHACEADGAAVQEFDDNESCNANGCLVWVVLGLCGLMFTGAVASVLIW